MANYDLTMVPGQQGRDGPPSELIPLGLDKKWHRGDEYKLIWGYNTTKNITGLIWVPKGETVTTFRIAI
jgi:hypothetical protein